MEPIKSESIYELIQREWKLLLTLFLAGILFYIYPICHQAITWDNDSHIFDGTFSWYLRSRRWGICLVQKLLFMHTFVPSFWIVVNVACLSLTAVFTCHVFQFDKGWLKYLYGIVVISAPQYAQMMKFALTADAVGVGFILVSLGFLIYVRDKSWKANLAVLLLFIGTFSIYVSLIYVPLTLFLLLSAIHLSNDQITIKAWVRHAIRLGLITGLAYAIYYFISIRVLKHYHLPTTLPGYFADMIKWGKEPISELFPSLLSDIWRHLMGKSYFGEDVFILGWIPFLMVLVFVVKARVTASRKVLSSLLLLLAYIAPFTHLILLGKYSQPRPYFPQAFLFASLWCLMFQRLPKIKPQWVLTGLAILFVHNGYRVTQTFHYDTMIEQVEKNLALRIMNKIDDLGIELEKHRLLVVGEVNSFPIFTQNKHSFRQNYPQNIFSRATWRVPQFLQAHGFSKERLRLPSKETLLQLEQTIKSMPCWPQHNSIQLIDDVVIVKLSEKYNLRKDFSTMIVEYPIDH